MALDDLRQQAAAAGAKVLLVGDHRQLSSVDAGGAFGLLAERGRCSELRSLWRFRNRWEAGATRRLRLGDPAVLEDYEEQGRLKSGSAEVMIEAAYLGWQASEREGQSAVLVAADTHTVDALNARAHEDRVLAGLVSPEVLPLGLDGSRGEVGVGDRVVTRRNNRSLAVPGHGHVRNGSLWDVVATTPDGSLVVAPAEHHDTKGSEPDQSETVTLPAQYVAEHVDLGYATTAHRAQGLTVDACHTLVGSAMSREALYVAMTRGRDTNIAYVATDAVDPACDQIPDVGVVKNSRQVLEQVLARNSSERSATQSLDDLKESSGSVKTLAPIRETLVADADVHQWQPVLHKCGLTESQAVRVFESPARGALFAALRRGQADGHPMATVLKQLLRCRPLEVGDDVAHDVAAVLHQRIGTWMQDTVPPLTPSKPSQSGDGLGLDSLAATLAEIDTLVADRIKILSVVDTGSDLGTCPVEPDPSLEWDALAEQDPYLEDEWSLER